MAMVRFIGGPCDGKEYDLNPDSAQSLIVPKWTGRECMYTEEAGPSWEGDVGWIWDSHIYRREGDRLIYAGVEVQSFVDGKYAREVVK